MNTKLCIYYICRYCMNIIVALIQERYNKMSQNGLLRQLDKFSIDIFQLFYSEGMHLSSVRFPLDCRYTSRFHLDISLSCIFHILSKMKMIYCKTFLHLWFDIWLNNLIDYHIFLVGVSLKEITVLYVNILKCAKT